MFRTKLKEEAIANALTPAANKKEGSCRPFKVKPFETKKEEVLDREVTF